MPSYDVECSSCGYETITMVKLADLSAWDLAATCPECKLSGGAFRRVIKTAPMSLSGVKSTKTKLKSADKDAMRHQHGKRENKEAKAAAIESARKGE